MLISHKTFLDCKFLHEMGHNVVFKGIGNFHIVTHEFATTTTTTTGILMYSSIFIFDDELIPTICDAASTDLDRFMEECSRVLGILCEKCRGKTLLQVTGTEYKMKRAMEKIQDDNNRVCIPSFGCFDFASFTPFMDSENEEAIAMMADLLLGGQVGNMTIISNTTTITPSPTPTFSPTEKTGQGKSKIITNLIFARKIKLRHTRKELFQSGRVELC